MFTFITGVPGSGKSAFLVDRLAYFPDYQNRQVYVDGIPGLDHEKIPHTSLPFTGTLYDYKTVEGSPQVREVDNITGKLTVISESTGLCTVNNWPDWALPGDLIVVDECQKHFRARASGAHVPLAISEVEVHRSRYGVDLVFSSQKPSLVDANLKALCGQHIHIREGWFGRYIYEGGEVFNTESRTDRQLQSKRRYTLPKRAFDLYISAPTHNKKTRKLPFVVYLLPLIVLATAFFIWNSYTRVTSKGKHEQVTAAKAPPGEETSTGKGLERGFIATSAPFQVLTLDDYKPVIEGRPETAPLFNAIRQVVTMPIISACLGSEAKCICYSQQGTRVGEVNEERCRQLLKNGPAFNPYQQANFSPAPVFSQPVMLVNSSSELPES
jgi:zona occludens toxin